MVVDQFLRVTTVVEARQAVAVGQFLNALQGHFEFTLATAQAPTHLSELGAQQGGHELQNQQSQEVHCLDFGREVHRIPHTHPEHAGPHGEQGVQAHRPLAPACEAERAKGSHGHTQADEGAAELVQQHIGHHGQRLPHQHLCHRHGRITEIARPTPAHHGVADEPGGQRRPLKHPRRPQVSHANRHRHLGDQHPEQIAESRQQGPQHITPLPGFAPQQQIQQESQVTLLNRI